MNVLRFVALLLHTFGVYAFGTAFVGWLGAHRTRAGCVAPTAAVPRQADIVGGLILGCCFLWFAVMLTLGLLPRSAQQLYWILQSVQLVLTYSFPGLVMHVVYIELRYPKRQLIHVAWRACIGVAYVVGLSLATFFLLRLYGVIGWLPNNAINSLVGVSIAAMFAFTGVYCTLATSRRKHTSETSDQRSSRRWQLLLYVVLVGFALLIGVSQFTGDFGQVMQLVTSSIPLAFIFVGTYYESRFEFFDLFVKRAASLMLSFVVLLGFFSLLVPWLDSIELGRSRSWIYAILLLPFAMALPWIHGKLSGLLDNLWLGRSFSTVEAVKHFLSQLQNATDESQLIRRAEGGLEEIFQARADLSLDAGRPVALDFEVVQELPIGERQSPAGRIRMGLRSNHRPYFSEDVALLSSLADVLFYMLQNVRLQARKREQEQQARELSLHASRSELKALRAQINPHFLFNALNAIASLIHRDPVAADETVEQLAEVFRYTLRGSESEWALLDDELEFVGSYLEIERARFGKRLRVRVEAEPEVRAVRIPTMMVQTLVENAVKHGVSAVRGPARIEVDAERNGGELLIRVADSGPGVRERPGADAPGSRRKGAGYGLKNIRQRLAGHFGERAGLTIGRDDARQMTVATIRFPLDRELIDGEAQNESGSGSAGRA